MSYVAALDHLHALGQELATSAPRRKFDLAHMRTLATALGDPQKQFRSVLIAGTNGKGSTASTLASMLAASGVHTGIYTSPHLSRVTERIRTSPICHSERSEESPYFAGSAHTPQESPDPTTSFTEIPEEAFARLYFRVDETALQLVSAGLLPHPPSFFEALTALAFLYFAERKVDIAILEVGMGGRLDATNIVDPMLSVITDIALDHQDYLGNTITEIAREKAGILRPNGTLITLPQHPEANQAIGEAAVALNVRGISAADYLPDRNTTPATPEQSASAPLRPNHYDLHLSSETLHVRSPLPGEHQRRNIALAIATAVELRNAYGYKLANAAIEAGIANTSWPGRLEFLPPNLLLDVAHNPAGAWTLRAAIATLPEQQPRTLIFSCLRDKDLTEMARILFPLFDSTAPPPNPTERTQASNSKPRTSNPVHHIVLTPIHSPRAATIEDLLNAAHALDVPAHAAHDSAEALALARSLTSAGGLIIATGSIYLVGALRDAVLGQ